MGRENISECACTFFGHRDCPDTIMAPLKDTLEELINNYGVNVFYVGNHGAFDSTALSVLKELVRKYPHIRYSVVLAYLPQKTDGCDAQDFSDTIYPDGIELAPKRFAISRRNKWMLDRAEYVVTYITHSWGGAAQFAEKAARQKKTVRRLGTL